MKTKINVCSILLKVCWVPVSDNDALEGRRFIAVRSNQKPQEEERTKCEEKSVFSLSLVGRYRGPSGRIPFL